jgi:glycosyltransferase involved in cell wall biosynthesis
MPDLWSLSSASLVLLKKSDLFKSVIPSKIFKSMAMEKPVTPGVEGKSAGSIRAAEAVFCIEPQNSQELTERVLELYKNCKLAAKLGANGRRHVTKYFDRTMLARRYEFLLVSLAQPSAAVPPMVDTNHSSP